MTGFARLTMVFSLLCPAVGLAQETSGATEAWTPPRLADGQPDRGGIWNSVAATHTPLELPEALVDRDSFSAEDLQALVDERAELRGDGTQWSRPEDSQRVNEGDLAYAPYWFDTFWSEPVAGDAPALVVDPPTGRLPDWTSYTKELLRSTRDHLHDSYGYMESGDRCITRGVLGMMMPTAYNNGTLILQTPGYVVLHSEMIHNARIIPIDTPVPAGPRPPLWDGDPRGRWEDNTLVVESTGFRPVGSIRGPSALIRSRQTERQRVVERFTFVDPETLHYSLTIDDPDAYTAPWTVAFPMTRDDDYVQFEYACHEGNYSVPNALRGARALEQP
ncbi:MAG: hypothetical protein VYE68_12465 [Acidobacteriota bacterium]|nr:hypothetical protein [Acidobacteriota bacterium]